MEEQAELIFDNDWLDYRDFRIQVVKSLTAMYSFHLWEPTESGMLIKMNRKSEEYSTEGMAFDMARATVDDIFKGHAEDDEDDDEDEDEDKDKDKDTEN